MKDKIYTIPVTDAFDEGSECAFCAIEKKLEKDAVDYSLGAALMEPDFRESSNEHGFCRHHFNMMLNSPNPNTLGLTLLVQTYLEQIRKDLDKVTFTGEKVSLLKSNAAENEKAAKLGNDLNDKVCDCVICKKVENTLERYIDTFFYLWEKEPELKNKVLSSKGFCLSHYARIISLASKKLSKSGTNEFLSKIHTLQKENLARIQADVDWFIQKFDYRNADAPWKTSQDAPQRSVEKLTKFLSDNK